jgi:hypothetical protein
VWKWTHLPREDNSDLNALDRQASTWRTIERHRVKPEMVRAQSHKRHYLMSARKGLLAVRHVQCSMMTLFSRGNCQHKKSNTYATARSARIRFPRDSTHRVHCGSPWGGMGVCIAAKHDCQNSRCHDSEAYSESLQEVDRVVLIGTQKRRDAGRPHESLCQWAWG